MYRNSDSEGSWIGLYKYLETSMDDDPSAQYWLDGSTSTFRRWLSGNPDDDDTPCFRITEYGEFSDRPCYYGYGFVCKRTAGV